jgi:hypothetical protein
MQREFSNLFRREQAKIESHCPDAFVLRPLGSRGWLKDLFGQKIELQLLCERPGGWHTCREGRYELRQPARWLTSLAPYLRRLCRVLKHTVPVVGSLLADEWDEQAGSLTAVVEGMEELVELLPTSLPAAESHGEHGHAEGPTLRTLRHLLDELDPASRWGGLRKILTPEQHYLWLCEEHAADLDG